MADFIVEKEEQEAQRNPTGVSECLVNPRSRMQPVGLGHVDNKEAISEELVNELLPKAIPLDIVYPIDDGEVNFRTFGYAQCGLIRKGGISRSPGGTTFHCTVVPITAKHNLRTVKRKDDVLIPNQALINVEVGAADFVSEDLGWEPSLSDERNIREGEDGSRPAISIWGLDISTGKEIAVTKNPLTDPAYAFELVRPSFKLETRQKVAVVVNFRRKAKPTEESIKGAGPSAGSGTSSPLQIEKIYGKPDSVNIYTGEITYVGEHHIEYTCNTFTGCSGTVVFLLDKNQPDSVQRCDFGRAVAIHSGSHPFLAARNFGFKIRSDPCFEAWE